jgi:hypothetical protein
MNLTYMKVQDHVALGVLIYQELQEQAVQVVLVDKMV